ncbi:MAG TPA: hypothetical protein VE988_27615 [Gemmataceae bacterium]|nr:hypothetical protein [Gemmataceae bacterium]
MTEKILAPFAIAYQHGFPSPADPWESRWLVIMCGLALLFGYGFARRAVAPRNSVTRFGLSVVSWRDKRNCLAVGALISTMLWASLDFLVGDYFLKELFADLLTRREAANRHWFLLIIGWSVWTIVLAEMFAYYLVGAKRRRERKNLPLENTSGAS